MRRAGRWLNSLDEAASPKVDNGEGQEQAVIVCRQEKAVASRARTAAGSTHALQERCYRWWRVDLHHAIEVADVEPELERTSPNISHEVGASGLEMSESSSATKP